MYQFKHDVKLLNQFFHDVFVVQLKMEKQPEKDEYEYDEFERDVPRFLLKSYPYKPELLDKLIEYVEKLFTPSADEKETPSLDQATNPALRFFLTMMQFDKRLSKMISETGQSVGLVSPERMEKITPLLHKIRDAALTRGDLITAAMAQTQINNDKAAPRNESLELSIKEMVLKNLQAKAGLNAEEMKFVRKNLDGWGLYDLTAFAQGEVTDVGVLNLCGTAMKMKNEVLAKKLFDSFQLNERQKYYVFRCLIGADISLLSNLGKFIVPESEIVQSKMLLYLVDATEKLESKSSFAVVRMSELSGILKNLVEHKVNINARTAKGNTMLHVAAMNYASHIANEILFEIKGVDIEAKNAKGQTPLLFAVEQYMTARKPDDYYHFVSTLRRLLEHGADINAVDGNGKTAMMLAKEKGDEQLVKILEEHSTGVWLRFRKSGAPVVEMKADFKEDLKILPQDIDELVHLLQDGPEPFDEKQFHAENESLEKKFEKLYPLCKTPLKKMLDGLRSKIEEYADDKSQLCSDYLKYLLLFVKGASKNDLKWLERHLCMAARLNDSKLVNLLLAIKVDVNARDNVGIPAIIGALETENINPDIIQAFINHKVDLAATNTRLNLKGQTALMTACLKYPRKPDAILRHETILQMLIRYSIDQRVSLAAVTPKGETALLLSARLFSPVALRTFLNTARREGVDIGISKPDHMQKTVLHKIFINRSPEDEKRLGLSWYVELLLRTDPKLKIDSLDSEGETPLLRALREECNRSAEVILMHGADPSLKNAAGRWAVFDVVTAESNPQMYALVSQAYHDRKAEKEAVLEDKRAKAVASREPKAPSAVTVLFDSKRMDAPAASVSARPDERKGITPDGK